MPRALLARITGKNCPPRHPVSRHSPTISNLAMAESIRMAVLSDQSPSTSGFNWFSPEKAAKGSPQRQSPTTRPVAIGDHQNRSSNWSWRSH